jgi:hypothetical protein
MAFLKQMQLAPVRERQGVVGDHSQLPALCILERARALDPIDRQKATVVLEPTRPTWRERPRRGTRPLKAARWHLSGSVARMSC